MFTKCLENKTLFGVILLFIMLCSCRKDSKTSNQIENNHIVASPALSIKDAQSYLAKDQGIVSNNTLQLYSNDHRTQKSGIILWRKAIEYRLGRYGVVEVPVSFNNKRINLYNIDSKEQPDESVFNASFSRIIIYLDTINKVIDKKIVTFIPDKESLRLQNYDISSNTLNTLKNNFNGYIEYLNWDLSIKSLLRIVNGKETVKYNVSLTNKSEKTIDGIKQLLGTECITYDVPYGETNCSVNAEGEYYNCTTYIDGYYTYIFCYDTGGDDDNIPQPDQDITALATGIANAFSPADAFNGLNGNKPISESPDKCSGAQDMWTRSTSTNPSREVFGVITNDNKFLTITVVGTNGGSISGLYNYNNMTYYTYPDSQGAPTQTYAGMVHAAGQYFIPIHATVHTHNPCLTDGTDGVSNMILSTEDQDLANSYPNINHYIIGCDALGQFGPNQTSPSLLSSLPLSQNCALMN